MAASKALRAWIGLVGATAILSGLQCFINEQYPRNRIYSMRPDQASPLLSRMFGVWTLLAGMIRLGYAISPDTGSLYWSTAASFALALAHFISEVTVYQTAPLCTGTILPIIIAGATLVWMILSTSKPKNT